MMKCKMFKEPGVKGYTYFLSKNLKEACENNKVVDWFTQMVTGRSKWAVEEDQKDFIRYGIIHDLMNCYNLDDTTLAYSFNPANHPLRKSLDINASPINLIATTPSPNAPFVFVGFPEDFEDKEIEIEGDIINEKGTEDK